MAAKRTSNHEKLSQPHVDDALASLSRTKRQATRQRLELEATIKQLEAKNADLGAMLSAAVGVQQVDDPEPIEPLGRKGPLPEATYVMLSSDWHVGERVRPKEVGGLNEYDPEIAEARAEQFFRSNLTMLQAARSAWNVNQLLWWWGGDFMTGYIHEEYQSENWLSPTEEMRLAYRLLLRGARFVLEHFDVERIVVATSNGNHGRDVKKKVAAGGYRKSYEFLMYEMLADALADEPRIQVQLGHGYENHVPVYGKRIRFHHGDEVQYNGGVGGIYPALYRRIHRANSGAYAADIDCHGHHHTLGFAPGTASNGCFAAGTDVLVPGGVKPIETIGIGDAVLSRDGSIQVVEKTTKQQAERAVLIRAKGLPNVVTTTSNHEFWAIKGESVTTTRDLRHRISVVNERPRWVPAEWLSVGDWVHTPVLQGTKVEDPDWLWVLGLFLAEGHTIVEGGSDRRHHRVEFSMHLREVPVLERAAKIIEERLGVKVRRWTRPTRTTSHISFNGKALAREWREEFGHGAHHKKVPAWMFELSPECRAAVVRGWVDGDGHRGRQKSASSVSEQLAWGMYQLALGATDEGEPMLYIQTKRPTGPKGACNSWRVAFGGGQDVLWVEGERFVRVDYRATGASPLTVYDLQVSGEHTYTAGGMGVHNSLIGPNSFGISKGFQPEEPMQASFVIDAKHRIPSACNPILVREPRRPTTKRR